MPAFPQPRGLWELSTLLGPPLAGSGKLPAGPIWGWDQSCLRCTEQRQGPGHGVTLELPFHPGPWPWAVIASATAASASQAPVDAPKAVAPHSCAVLQAAGGESGAGVTTAVWVLYPCQLVLYPCSAVLFVLPKPARGVLSWWPQLPALRSAEFPLGMCC